MLGHDIYDDVEINEDHLHTIKELIKSGKLVVGIFEGWKMNNIYDLLAVPKNESTLRPRVVDSNQLKHIWKKIKDGIVLDEKLKQDIQNSNKFDILLHDYVCSINSQE